MTFGARQAFGNYRYLSYVDYGRTMALQVQEGDGLIVFLHSCPPQLPPSDEMNRREARRRGRHSRRSSHTIQRGSYEALHRQLIA